ncbi:hypothetical protein C7M84_006841 [Penaeus vannamei]|uniref:Uncharacterized protein n=1 Tax=Penaeus vannamei TaxID=6689 RepID=A0A423TDV2_PENVA|nr:hypothetical protein C7M84_006841 [Penaeus vannamei]
MRRGRGSHSIYKGRARTTFPPSSLHTIYLDIRKPSWSAERDTSLSRMKLCAVLVGLCCLALAPAGTQASSVKERVKRDGGPTSILSTLSPHRRRRQTRVRQWRTVVHVGAAFWAKGRRRQLLAGRLGALRQWQLPGRRWAKGLHHQGDHGVVQVVLRVEGPLQDPDLLRLTRLLPCPAPSGSSPRVCWS